MLVRPQPRVHLMALVATARLLRPSRREPAMASGLSLVSHLSLFTASVVMGSWILRAGCDALLRLIAGLVAILSSDKRSRADRALDVLDTMLGDRKTAVPPLKRQAQQRQVRAPVHHRGHR